MGRPAVGSWRDVEELLSARPPGTVLRLPRGWVEHPRAHHMRPTIDLPDGQVGDWLKRLDGGQSLHVTSMGSFYLARLETTLQMGARRDDRSCVESSLALGALVGAMLGRSAAALLVGAALAGAVSVLEERR